MLFLKIILVLFLITWGVITFYPPLGAKPDPADLTARAVKSIYADGTFQNQTETVMDFSFGTSVALLKEWIFSDTARKPLQPLPMDTFDPAEIRPSDEVSFIWVGHSSLIMNWRGKHVLVDPMFGNAPSPFPWLAGERFTGGLPFEVEKLPAIDAVIYSHDHYDHLDYGTLLKIKDKVSQFFVPLGVGGHLIRWGVDPAKIKEFDWWQETEWNGLKLVNAPARHFSGRSLTDRNATLWSSWIVMDEQTRVYLSGDSGYGPHFKEIGDKYGPFDLAFLENGQYNPAWQAIHMMPEEGPRAALDLNARLMMPIHWGAFVLSLHSWDDPVRSVTKAAEKLGMPIIVPKIGERVILGEPFQTKPAWWSESPETTMHIPASDSGKTS